MTRRGDDDIHDVRKKKKKKKKTLLTKLFHNVLINKQNVHVCLSPFTLLLYYNYTLISKNFLSSILKASSKLSGYPELF